MSWKGFKKALERMPHQIQSKISRSVTTVDDDYENLKSQFVEMEKSVKELFRHATEFRDSIRNMLIYQTAYLEQVLAVYKPISTDPESSSQPVGSFVDEGASPELLRVAEEFQRRVLDIKGNVEPQLGRMDISVIGPIQEMIAMMRNVHKVMAKRDHKLIDYDRYRTAVEKAEAKEGLEGQRRLPEERAYQKNGVQYQEATRQYNYYNDMIKAQLKQLLDLRQPFIDPIFLKFFRVQHSLYSSMFREFSDAARNCPAFDLTTPVLVGWQRKWGLAEQHLAGIDLWGQGSMTVTPIALEDPKGGKFGSLFRKKDKAPTAPTPSMFRANSHMASPSPSFVAPSLPAAGGSSAYPPAANGSSAYPPAIGGSSGFGSPAPSSSFKNPQEGAAHQPPGNSYSPAIGSPAVDHKSPYGAYQSKFPSPPFQQSAKTAEATGPNPPALNPPPSYYSSTKGTPAASSTPAPPPPRPAPVQFVDALYDYNAQAEGDLSFREGDRIELLERSPSKNDWWTGRLNGVTGVFPGTYVTDPK
ncbi:BAR adaptor protein Hob1 [Coemansia spiralis]|uniref:BAR adaptor protein Hob1 n=2 Tax=Coemansia TaxID=4863 RepID=A0A9W8L009_9FUNG|nr:BAR adaptor protein Hob1 [Coemansia umbellata]KAJ2624540.1 BAR adaptor protein Hob1 [Coemansia sp. RSA 1358]KAJ2679492.1 BAR adaptor protein Hob1 [Coemansia spiralis]